MGVPISRLFIISFNFTLSGLLNVCEAAKMRPAASLKNDDLTVKRLS